MYSTKIFSFSAIVVGLVLLGAGCYQTAQTNTNVAPVVNNPANSTEPQPSSDQLPQSQPTNQPSGTVAPNSGSASGQTGVNTSIQVTSPAPALAPAPAPKKVSATIASFSFQPNSLTISSGDTVVWTNNDSVPHTVTADDGSFSSGAISPGVSFSHTFSSAGTFAYSCSFHASMHGSVTVK